MRTVAIFCLKYFEIEGSDDYFIKDILVVKNFRTICRVAAEAWPDALSPASKLGNYLKEIVVVLQNEAIMENDNASKMQYDNLIHLIDTEWVYVSAPNRRKLNEQKEHVQEMPITNDIKLFLHYSSMEIAEKVQYLIENKTEPVLFNDFIRLIKLVLAYIIVFNRRREGEVSCVKLEQYTHKPDYNDYETDICRDSLSDTEKILVKQFNYMSTRGKRGRRVPILYSGLI